MTKINAFTYSPFPISASVRGKPAVDEKPKQENANQTFSKSLETECERLPVKLSKHARERMNLRNIQISSSEWQLIHSKMQEARKMGINDSLVLTKDAALVVNTSNQTVITAMGLDEAGTRIFSNINGTIVINQ
ncbi:flagellar operon protein [Sporolactobacillus shoreicorticis]|uniref:TIGR02530 family flagellar biosynthesis protein n=1 Tax=Sporolactobacillus shoreicorticis TaxID=1923877 RepID=A0ABW5S8W7_9BACL|nr:TIGR02530 family flagellar biosynthesis protein [Sporolactobacillus shoreicorticis]MCO7125992.1 flagellar operon protein [Sporolactobacillus shoreicorticis]